MPDFFMTLINNKNKRNASLESVSVDKDISFFLITPKRKGKPTMLPLNFYLKFNCDFCCVW